jgi:hypothetical protein
MSHTYQPKKLAWYCPGCNKRHDHGKKICDTCEGSVMLKYECKASESTGTYSYWHHQHHLQCNNCHNIYLETHAPTSSTIEQHHKDLHHSAPGSWHHKHYTSLIIH